MVDGSVRVNESLLTGESDEIAKEVGDELLSGSFVVSGEVMAQLVKVGSETIASEAFYDSFFELVRGYLGTAKAQED